MKKRIALLYGGTDSEHDVSLLGYEYILELLKDSPYDILPVYVTRMGEWQINLRGGMIPAFLTGKDGGSLYTGYGFIKIDGAIPLLHGDGGEDGKIQGALECAHVPYVGADVCASAVCIDKIYTKRMADGLGIPTLPDLPIPKHLSTEDALGLCLSKIGLPMFVKPRRLGSSVGAGAVRSEEEFRELYPIAKDTGGGLVMAEKLLDNKRELECALCVIHGRRIITPPGEILIDGFYGKDEKYSGRTKTDVRADVPGHISQKITDMCILLSDALDLKHLCRIDFFLSGEEIYFNEINTFPGFTRESLYPKMLEGAGVHPREALISFIEDSLSVGRTV